MRKRRFLRSEIILDSWYVLILEAFHWLQSNPSCPMLFSCSASQPLHISYVQVDGGCWEHPRRNKYQDWWFIALCTHDREPLQARETLSTIGCKAKPRVIPHLNRSICVFSLCRAESGPFFNKCFSFFSARFFLLRFSVLHFASICSYFHGIKIIWIFSQSFL